jgi:hypothetical protein
MLSAQLARSDSHIKSKKRGRPATVDNKTRLQALALVNDCYKYIMDLTTNCVVITDGVK